MDKIDTAVGFLGCGGIASALTEGLCGASDFTGRIFVFNRNPAKAEALEALCPDKVKAVRSNQDVVDAAEVIFPALVPDVLRQVAPSLRIRPENRIVHIAAGIKLAEARSWFEPAASIVRCVPLPFAARRMGPVVLYGEDAKCESLLALLGSVVKVGTEKDLEILAAITGMMVSYYALVGETVRWGMSKGIDFKSALDYTTLMNEALSVLMRNDCTEDIEPFLLKHTTPNGMNELGLRIMRGSGAYAAWTEALEQIGRRYGL
jgi:pyrroline-5-carboxylate reductase